MWWARDVAIRFDSISIRHVDARDGDRRRRRDDDDDDEAEEYDLHQDR